MPDARDVWRRNYGYYVVFLGHALIPANALM
jgi:hypothetical protein